MAGDAGIPFEPDTLTAAIRRALDMSEPERGLLRARAMDRVRQHYSWDAITGAYEKLLQGLAR